MRKYVYVWLTAMAFSSSVIAENKQFVIKLQGNTLYREKIVEKSALQVKKTQLNAVSPPMSETSNEQKDALTVSRPDRSAYLIIQSHCLDKDSLNPLDSVIMDVYSNGEHITAGISDKSGFIMTDSIPPGNYYVVLYRKDYKSFSTFVSKTSINSHSYIDIPLKKNEKYVGESFGQRMMKYLLCWQAIPFLLLIYFINFLYRKVIRYAM